MLYCGSCVERCNKCLEKIWNICNSCGGINIWEICNSVECDFFLTGGCVDKNFKVKCKCRSDILGYICDNCQTYGGYTCKKCKM